MKIKWKVEPAPTGRYKSFHRRGWPTGFVLNAKNRVLLRCDDEYIPRNIREGDHGEITIHVDILRDGELRLVRLRAGATTLPEAKEIAARFFADHPEYILAETATA